MGEKMLMVWICVPGRAKLNIWHLQEGGRKDAQHTLFCICGSENNEGVLSCCLKVFLAFICFSPLVHFFHSVESFFPMVA